MVQMIPEKEKAVSHADKAKNHTPSATPAKRTSTLSNPSACTPKLSTASARSSTATSSSAVGTGNGTTNPRTSANTSQTPRTVKRSNLSTSSSVSNSNSSSVSTGRITVNPNPTSTSTPSARSRFNSLTSQSSNSNINPNAFTPTGRKLTTSNPSSMTTMPNTMQRMRVAQGKAAANAAAASENLRTTKTPMKKSTSSKTLVKKKEGESWLDNEPIKAFLRVRPASKEGRKEHLDQHLEVLNENEVLLSPNESYLRSTGRVTQPTKYSFTKVFSSQTPSTLPSIDLNSQSNFFKETTLPMIKDLLNGRSGLVCAYGVTNSGKSFTIQGEKGEGREGVLPRTVDTVFNSVEGLHSESMIRPSGLYGVEQCPPEESPIETSAGNPYAVQSIFAKLFPSSKNLTGSKKAPQSSSDSKARNPSQATPFEKDDTKVQVDRNLRYSIWVSYVELYNEKFFDLLDVTNTDHSTSGRSNGNGNGNGMTRSHTSNWSLAGSRSVHDSQNGSTNGGGGVTLNRKAIKLDTDPETGSFYLGGAREIKVKSAEEAKALILKGQENRAVFGTMANRVSSRSHGIFTMKVISEHGNGNSNGAKDPEESLGSNFSTSRLTIVDLAGTERAGNTGTTLTSSSSQHAFNNLNGLKGLENQEGRLNEAKSINQSLFCFTNCLQVLRNNQTLANNLLNPNLDSKKSKPSVVPFRQSQLTRMLKPFLSGNESGKTVIILNLNPFDTGFSENSEALKFSAVAQEIKTGGNTTVGRNQLLSTSPVKARKESFKSVGKNDAKDGNLGKLETDKQNVDETQRTGKGSMEAQKDPTGDGDVTIIEISDSEEEEDEDDDGANPFVDYLLQQHEELRQQLFEAQMRCAVIEAQVRDQMASEMDQQLQEMERLFNQRALNEAEQYELLANRKLDLLSKFNDTQQTPRASQRDVLEEDGGSEGEEAEEDDDEEEEGEVEKEMIISPSSSLRLSDLVVNHSNQSTSPSEVVKLKRHPLASSSSDSPDDSSTLLRPGKSSASDISNARRKARLSVEAENFDEKEEEEDEDEEDDLDESSEPGSGEESQNESQSQETSSEISDSEGESEVEASQEEESEEEEEEEVVEVEAKAEQEAEGKEAEGNESSEAQIEDLSSGIPTSQPIRTSSRSNKGVNSKLTPSSSIPDGNGTGTRPRRKAAAVANAKTSSSLKGKEVEKDSKIKKSDSKKGNALKERLQIEEDVSDTSLIVQPTKEKKKRVLRSKQAIDEETMLDSIADSSLIRAVNNSKRIISNNKRLR